MNKKKILYIHHGKGLGGAPLSLLLLINALDKEKYHPVVLFLHDSQVVELYKQNNIEIVGIVNRYDFSHTKVWWFRWYHLTYFLRSAWDTFRTEQSVAGYWLDKIKPDLVHLNTSSLIAWGKVASKKGIPVIWHVREPLADGYLGFRKWIIKKCVAKYSSKILPICKHDALPWKDNPKTCVIYNAVDPKKFDFNIADLLQPGASPMGDGSTSSPRARLLDPLILSLSKDRHYSGPKILFLGGLSQEKGTLVIFKAFEKVLKQLPKAKLLVASYFDLDLSKTSYLKKLFPAYKFKVEVANILEKIKKSVVLLGPIQDIPQAMAASDLIVFPATVGHFARPIIEAGFMKKPVIASDLAPLDELVVNNQTGYLVDPNDINAWADKLLLLLTDKDLNKKMGDAGYNFCIQHFTVSSQKKFIENIYEQF
ncbi:MAG: glycosyltransferase family 4 protein [bacterium]